MAEYDRQSLMDLKDRTEYESWLLEAAYEIVDHSLFPEWPDQLIYSPVGGAPQLIAYGGGIIVIGDWRPHFLNVGAPLLFVTTFKIIDMVVEWVLEQNGQPSTHRFQQTIAAVKVVQQLPPFANARPWLWERLKALYEQLEPLRGTVVHARQFKTVDGDLDVAESKRGVVGPTITVSQKEIRTLAVFAVSLLRYLEGAWQINSYREKLLRRTVDDLMRLHHFPSLGQQAPRFVTARVHAIERNDAHWVDLTRIRGDLAKLRPDNDVIFDIRLVTVASDGSRANAYIFPWAELEFAGARLVRDVSELASYTAEVPPDVDPVAVARALQRDSDQYPVAG